MSTASKVADLVNLMPDCDKGGELTGPEWASAEPVYRDLLEIGPDAVIALVGMLVPPGQGDDRKARYVLHGLAVYVCRPPGTPWRSMFIKTLGATLTSDRPKPVQQFIIQQLQIAGTAEATPALGSRLLDEDLCEPAAQALLAIRDGAAEQFRQAIKQARGAQRLTIVQALGVLRDATSIDDLMSAAREGTGEVRLAALTALASIGEPRAVQLLLDSADASQGYERIAATDACFSLAERLVAAGHESDARRIYAHLEHHRRDAAETHVRQAAAQATVNIDAHRLLVTTGLDPGHAPRAGQGWSPLFNGKDLTGWNGRANDLAAWKVVDGVMVNDVGPGIHGADIVTTGRFYDFEIYYEYVIPKGSNSGLYLRGRYEIQIWDDYGKELRDAEVAKRINGALYNVAAPAVRASKPPEQWQSVFARILGHRVTIVLNGVPIIQGVEVRQPTGSHYDDHVGTPGPIMIQGDHGRVSFRNLYIRPLRPNAGLSLG